MNKNYKNLYEEKIWLFIFNISKNQVNILKKLYFKSDSKNILIHLDV